MSDYSDTDDLGEKSKSQVKRELLALQALGERLPGDLLFSPRSAGSE